MAFSACRCFFTLLILIAASPIQTHARDSKFFSKVTRSEPESLDPKTEEISPSSSPLPETETETETETKTEPGYGLYGKEETYEYAPTTTNPTKSEPGYFKYVQPSGVKEGNRGNQYEAAERQGMSDTRFLENGRYFYDVNSEKEGEKLSEEDDGHGSYYGQRYESGNQYRDTRYQTEEEQKSNNVEFYGTDKYRKQFQRTGEKQGMSDTRYLENGRYFYDIQGESREDGNGVESYQGESYDSNYEEEDEVSDGYKGKQGYGFKETPNKFPRYEFDSMEEYEKYEQERNRQKYAP